MRPFGLGLTHTSDKPGYGFRTLLIAAERARQVFRDLRKGGVCGRADFDERERDGAGPVAVADQVDARLGDSTDSPPSRPFGHLVGTMLVANGEQLSLP